MASILRSNNFGVVFDRFNGNFNLISLMAIILRSNNMGINFDRSELKLLSPESIYTLIK